jgi:transposase
VKLPSCPVKTFASNVRKRNLTPSLQALLESGLQTLETIGPQLHGVEVQLAQLCAVEPVVQLLATAPGVALIVAASFVSVIDEAQRFHQAHEVESYLGLVPSESTTGGAVASERSARRETATCGSCWCRRPGRCGAAPVAPTHCGSGRTPWRNVVANGWRW